MTIDQIIKVDIAISEAMAVDGGYDTILIIGPLPKTPGGHMTPDVAGYTGTQDLKSAGFSTDDPVYISASKVFSQSPKPSMVMVAVQKTTSGSTEKVDVTLDRAKAVPGWYCICPAGIKEDFYQSIADWTESNEKLCVCETTGISASPVSDAMFRTAVIHATKENDCVNGIVWAFAPEYEHLMLALGGFEWINNIDKCNGVLLNRIGQLVCLTRQQAGAMIGSRELADNDDIYRVCLKYKAYVNSCRCTPNEIIEATKIIFGATEVVYSERRDVPATIYLSISAPFSDLVLSILGTHDLVVHPAGVRVRINCSTEDAETFGFVDLNPRVAGFGEGMFAQSIN